MARMKTFFGGKSQGKAFVAGKEAKSIYKAGAAIYQALASFALEYSGAHTRGFISVDGVERELITITGSGLLTVTGNAIADVCLVAGGENGLAAISTTAAYGGSGGRGGKILNKYEYMLVSGAVQIGAGNNGSTSYADLVAQGTGTGAGIPSTSGSDRTRNVGDGVPTRPFGSPLFDAHCGGGGSGRRMDNYAVQHSGGNGGTNGGGGTVGIPSNNSIGQGGTRGGGNGGDGRGSGVSTPGEDAIFYGSGGGGGGFAAGTAGAKGGGAGYQGVMYILLPAA